MLSELRTGNEQSELFPSTRTLEGSSACFRFVKRLGKVVYNPDDAELGSFSMGEDALQRHLEDEQSFAYNVRVGELLHELSGLCGESRPPFVRNLVTNFFQRNLRLIDGLIDRRYAIPGEDVTVPDVRIGAVCLEAISCLIISGNPEYRKQAYDFLGRHKDQFIKSLEYYGDMLAFDKVLNNLISDPLPPQTETEREFSVVADFCRMLLPLKGKGLFTESWTSWPREIIHEWIGKYFTGEASPELLFEISSRCADFSQVAHHFTTIFGGRDDSYAGEEAKAFADYWLKGRLSFEVSDEDFNRVVRNLSDFAYAVRNLEYDRELKDKVFHFKRALKAYLVSCGPYVLLQCEPIIKLVENKILPTPYLSTFVAERGERGFDEINKCAAGGGGDGSIESNQIRKELAFLDRLIATYNTWQRVEVYSETRSESHPELNGPKT